MKSKAKLFNQTLLSALANDPVADEKARPQPSKHSYTSKRIGQCEHDDQTEFSGYYHSLSLNNCKLVKINNVVAKSFSSNDSYVEVQHSVLGSRGGVTNIKDSAIKAMAASTNFYFNNHFRNLQGKTIELFKTQQDFYHSPHFERFVFI
jgi:hypothetical protein